MRLFCGPKPAISMNTDPDPEALEVKRGNLIWGEQCNAFFSKLKSNFDLKAHPDRASP